MKNKIRLVACSVFLTTLTLTVVTALAKDDRDFLFGPSNVKAGNDFSITLNSQKKYVEGVSKAISTDANNGATVLFGYTNALPSNTGHVILQDGGTLKNLNQLTSLSYFVPSFSLASGALLKFRASNDGETWGNYAEIKPYTNDVTLNSFNIPYMRYVEFQAEGGQVDINSISFCYTCSESDNNGADNYECRTVYSDLNLGNYSTDKTYNELSSGLTVYTQFNGGETVVLNSNDYDVSVKNPSGEEINKASNLVAGTHTVTISRKDRAFADVSYNFEVVSDPFTVTTDLSTPKEIHTQLQKTYLSYNGDYATMNSSDYPDGNQLLSDPLPVELNWTHNVPSGKILSKYTVTFGQNPDLTGGYEVEGNTTPSIQLYNAFLGTNYFRIKAKFTDNSEELSTIRTFLVDETGPRNIYVTSNMTNCRDCGGRATTSGGRIRQGMLYRTCGNGYQTKTGSTKTYIDATGKAIMLDQLKVKSEINVSDGTTYNLNLNGTTIYNAYMDYGGNAKDHFSRNAESVKNVFKILSDVNNYPVFFHCRIGTDRTGLIANLFYGLLGVPLNMIYQDYLFSNFGNIEGKRYIGSAAGEDDISKYMNEISNMPGNTFQEKVYNTLLSIGIPSTTLNAVIDLMTVGNKPDNAQGQMAVNAANMTVTGGSITTVARSSITDRNEPESYISLGSNTSASFSFTTTKTGTAKIYGYLGHNDYTTSKTLNNSVSVFVDDVEISVPSRNFKEIGMGNCSNRTNYYFVNLGEKTNLTTGTHTVKIVGKANNMKLGTLSVFGVPGSAEINQGGNGGNNGNENQGGNETNEIVVASFLATGSSSKSDVDEITNNVGTYVKLKTNNSSYVEYKFNSTVQGTAYLKTYAATKAGNATSSNKLWFDGSTAKFAFKVNGNDVEFTDSTTTFADTEIGNGSAGGSGDSSVPGWIEFPQITIVNGENTIRLTRTGGYSLYFYEFKVVTR